MAVSAEIGYTNRNILWRRSYDRNRYARMLSQAELDCRIRDVLLNLLCVTSEGRIGIYPISNRSVVWMEKWTHVLEEMQLRHGPYPSGFRPEILQPEPLPNFASELAHRAAERLSSVNVLSNQVFIKFGKRNHMEKLYKSGALRIQPASSFMKSGYNGAVRDDELKLAFSFGLSREDVVKLVVNPHDVPQQIPEQRVDVRFSFPSDYWVYCMTTVIQPRLFVDFGVEACVIIKDRAAFRELLSKVQEPGLNHASMTEGPVVYVDPLLPTSPDVVIPRFKHFRYSYQEEYRFSWVPDAPVPTLNYVDLCIGSLESIAELVTL